MTELKPQVSMVHRCGGVGCRWWCTVLLGLVGVGIVITKHCLNRQTMHA